MKRYLLGINQFSSDTVKFSADLNRDGSIDSIDYTLLRRYILNVIDAFPVEKLNPVQKNNNSLIPIELKEFEYWKYLDHDFYAYNFYEYVVNNIFMLHNKDDLSYISELDFNFTNRIYLDKNIFAGLYRFDKVYIRIIGERDLVLKHDMYFDRNLIISTTGITSTIMSDGKTPVIIAAGDIVIDINSFNFAQNTLDLENIHLYSMNGNITIETSNVNFCGTIFAHNGTVTLKGINSKYTGVIYGKNMYKHPSIDINLTGDFISIDELIDDKYPLIEDIEVRHSKAVIFE